MTFIEEIPIVGQFIPACISLILFYFMWGKGWFMGTKSKIWLWIIGQFVDIIPIIGFLPVSTLTVILTWRLIRKKAKKAEAHLETLKMKTLDELQGIEAEYSEFSHDEQEEDPKIRTSRRNFLPHGIRNLRRDLRRAKNA